MKNRIVFRGDGNSKIGWGHFMRLLSIEEKVHNEYATLFIVNANSKDVIPVLNSKGIQVAVLPEQLSVQDEPKYIMDRLVETGDVVFIDGYEFKASYLKKINQQDISTIYIDDLIEEEVVTDALINHSVGISTKNYRAKSPIYYGLGTSYALVSNAFSLNPRNKWSENDDSIFVCLGGADPDNNTLKVTKNLIEFEKSEIINVLVGNSYSNLEELEDFIKKHPNVSLFQGLEQKEISLLMRKAKFSICSSSNISYEYCTVGGGLFTLQTADNQKEIHRFLLNKGLAKQFDFSNRNELSVSEIEKQFHTQRSYFKVGDNKIKKLIHHCIQNQFVEVEIATEEHGQLYFDWANDPLVRESAFCSDPIEFNSHIKWFLKKVSSEDSHLVIGFINGKPFGQVRFDVENKIALIGYSIAAEYRGAGLGTALIIKAINFVKREYNLLKFKAEVKEENVSSWKVFERIGFDKIEPQKNAEADNDKGSFFTFTLTL